MVCITVYELFVRTRAARLYQSESKEPVFQVSFLGTNDPLADVTNPNNKAFRLAKRTIISDVLTSTAVKDVEVSLYTN